MKDTLQKRALETIRRYSMIRPGDRIGVGVSGGADSVALLRLLVDLQAKLGIGILALHFHHQLRGADADEDERFVRDLARKLSLEFVSDRADVASQAKINGLNLEDAARRLRYEFFASVAVGRSLNRVAVAHTADDQAETVLAHLLRGTGLTGLAGIYPIAGLTVRPLLEIRREELRQYLSGLHQMWREDTTNQDTSRMRARIRHRLLPLLMNDFDPSTVTRLARLANHAREDETFWQALEEDRFRALTTRETAGEISLQIEDLRAPLSRAVSNGANAEKLESHPESMLALSRRLVRRIYAELRNGRQQLTAGHVQDVLDLATKSRSGASIELPGVSVRRDFDRLVFSLANSEIALGKEVASSHDNHAFEYTISSPRASGPARIVVPEIGRRFSLKVIDWPPASRETNLSRGTLDFDRLRWPMVLRNWRPGDAYRPAGRVRVRKLKRMFLEARIPRRARETWPVLTSEGKLVWAAGYPVAEEFAPRSGTRTGLVIAEDGIK